MVKLIGENGSELKLRRIGVNYVKGKKVIGKFVTAKELYELYELERAEEISDLWIMSEDYNLYDCAGYVSYFETRFTFGKRTQVTAVIQLLAPRNIALI